MKCVNYRIFGAMFRWLELIGMVVRVDFLQFDPDDEEDVEMIASLYFKPNVEKTKPEKQEAIRRTMAYYTTVGNAPFQQLGIGLRRRRNSARRLCGDFGGLVKGSRRGSDP
jgi:hypothetical protein